jgi:hypothetical protein
MISLSKQKHFLQIILEFTDPTVTDRIAKSARNASDVIWVNVTNLRVYEFIPALDTFKELNMDLFKDVIYLNYRKFIIVGNKELVVPILDNLIKLSAMPGLNQLVKRASTSNALLARIPRHIIIADSKDKLMLVLFQLLIRITPTTFSQLTANLLNASNIFDNLIIDSTVNV